MYKIVRFLILLPFEISVFIFIFVMNMTHSRNWKDFIKAMKDAYK
ncbi:hypothetical protein [Sutcliffiella horikoshii]|nr:hypothetical protein [Sutcliffiella horikoshii]